MIDVTSEHDAREMLLLHKEDLERRVDERTDELREANELMTLEIGERRRMDDDTRAIEAALPHLPEARALHFSFADIPSGHVRGKGRPGGAGVLRALAIRSYPHWPRRLLRDVNPDVVWHLTLTNAWMGSVGALACLPSSTVR